MNTPLSTPPRRPLLSALRLAVALLVLLTANRVSDAQTPGSQTSGATISGIVRDSASNPFPGVEVLLTPGEQRAVTDADGRFSFTDVKPGRYVVRARRFGYIAADRAVTVDKGMTVGMRLVLERQPVSLDTMTVTAQAECPALHYEGFLCRRNRPGGVFMDKREIDAINPVFLADLFWGVKGFVVAPGVRGPVVRSDRGVAVGPAPGAAAAAQGGVVAASTADAQETCIRTLVDGLPPVRSGGVPQRAGKIIAVEAYPRPESVPPEYQQYAWPDNLPAAADVQLHATGASFGPDLTRTLRCALIIYWTGEK